MSGSTTGETSLCLRALAALAGELGLVVTTHMVLISEPISVTTILGDLMPSSGLSGYQAAHYKHYKHTNNALEYLK